MAGIQIDGVNNKIDFDDDLDTSISANTDDTLVIEAGGNTMATITATTFTINDGTTITTADNSDTLSLVSTDADSSSGPNQRFYRNSSSPANSDILGTIDFEGRNNNSQDVVYANILTEIASVADGNEFGVISLQAMRNGTLTTAMQIGSGINISVADNADNLTLISTDADDAIGPNLRLYRNSGSPADADNLGTIDFEGRNDNSQDVVYAQFLTQADDVSDGNEDGIISLKAMTNGTSRELLRLSGNGGAVFNELSQDIDFRVESNGNTAMLHVNAGNDSVGIGTDSSVAPLHLMTNAPNFRISDANSSSEDSATGSIQFYDRNSDINSEILSGTGSTANLYLTNYNNRDVIIQTGGQNDRFTVHGSGRVEVGASDDNTKFKVTSTTTGENVIRAFANSTFTSTVIAATCNRNTTNGSYNMFVGGITGVADKFIVADSGNVTNTNNSYGATSDERLKSNIVDASSQWNDIKALKVRNYKRFDTDTTQLGVVAQELETANMNGLVQEKNPDEYEIKHNSAFGTLYTSDDEETKDGDDAVLFVTEDKAVQNGRAKVGDVKTKATHSKKVGDIKEIKEQVKSVKYSVLYMKAIKALQEAQTRIETLETKVAALEG